MTLTTFLRIGALAACASWEASAADPRSKVIIDQDAYGPGGSNLQCILMVVQDPTIEVLGITIESGDGWQKENVAHTLRMLELIGRTDIPVVPGATYPLLDSEEETRRLEKLYGKLAYKGAWMDAWPDYNTVNRPHYHAADVVPPLEEGEPTTKPSGEIAANFLVRKVREFPGQVSILAVGPFTNLALASRLDDQFASLAKQVVFMAGSFNPDVSKVDEFSMQFINTPRVEFNSRWDPEAAKMMLHAGWKKVISVPLDATVDTKFTREIVRRATEGCDTPAAKYVARFAQPRFPMWDEVAAVVLIDPSVVRHADKLAVDIEIDHGPNYGATLSWPPGGGPGLGEPDVLVVRAVDVPRLEEMFVAAVRRPPLAP
jgi:inosine-uridine nucleoside N-ribohydrolase